MEEIVKQFLEKGKLLTPEALEYIKNKEIERILVGELPGIIITKASLETGIRIIKNLASKKKELSAEEIASFYRAKYEKLREIILQRIQKNFVSLNKLGTHQEVYVVGIVKDIKENNGKTIVELEDITGSVQIITGSSEVELDDVVAFRATSAGRILFGHQIIYPDIPLRKPATGFGKACFISDLHLNEAPKAGFERFLQWFEMQNIETLFVAGDIGEKHTFEELVSQYCADKTIFVIPGEIDKDEEYPQTAMEFSEKNIVPLSNPSMVEVNGLKILLTHELNPAMLKKRYLGKNIIYSDYLVLEEVPDIVHHGHTDEASITNYKSVTLVNSGSLLTKFSPVIIDFSTREAVLDGSWNKV